MIGVTYFALHGVVYEFANITVLYQGPALSALRVRFEVAAPRTRSTPDPSNLVATVTVGDIFGLELGVHSDVSAPWERGDASGGCADLVAPAAALAWLFLICGYA